MNITESNIKGKKVVLAGLFSSKDKEIDIKLDSLEEIVTDLGGCIVERVIQRRGVSRSKKPGGSKNTDAPLNSATYLGQGKIEEIANIVKKQNIDIVVFSNSLSPTQSERVKNIIKCNVLCVNMKK